MMPEVVVATRSAGKVRELAPLLAAAGYRARSLDQAGVSVAPDEHSIEGFDTFEENAFAKARYFAAKCGLPVLAEDSGLEVAALCGEPGVRSKRWSGRSDLEGQSLDDANNALLVERLRGATSREARYVCVAVWLEGERSWSARGTCEGAILAQAEGSDGFGYDPWFLSSDLGISFGVASREAKARVSHRGRAVRALLTRVAKGR